MEGKLQICIRRNDSWFLANAWMTSLVAPILCTYQPSLEALELKIQTAQTYIPVCKTL